MCCVTSTVSRPAYRLVRRPPRVAAPPLDALQRRIVAHRSGPLLVLGGPGTGKTTALVEAVAARIAEGTDPGRILVLAFSRRGADRLRRQIAARLQAGTWGELAVRTFHGYAFALLRQLAARHGEPPPRLLTGPEQDLVIRELLTGEGAEELWPPALRPALRTRGFAAELRDLLLRAAERGVTPDQLAEYGRQLGRDDWIAAARFAQQYADVLALRDATTRGSVGYDTAELIRAATAQLEADPEALAAERRRCAYTYVDELHDVDPAQWDLLELVAGGGAHLVGFGDPDSSIFAFRGADPDGVLRMPERFRTATGEPAPVVTLTTCWRSGPALLEAAGRVAERLRGPSQHRGRQPAPRTAESAVAGKPVSSATSESAQDAAASEPAGDAAASEAATDGAVAKPAEDGEVEVRLFRSETQELAYLAQRLRAAHLLEKIPWSAMAVLVRASTQLSAVRRALLHAGVPVTVAADELPLAAQPAIRPLLTAVRCALDPERLNEETVVALLHSPFGGADPFTERRLRQALRELALAAGDSRPSGELLIEAVRDPSVLSAVDPRWAQPAQRIAGLLATAREAVAKPGVTAEEALWAVWDASGLAERWAAASAAGGQRGAAADRDLDAVLALFAAAARFTDRLPGAGPGAFIDHLASQEIPADTLAPAAEPGDAVRLLTVHSAKGQEWDVVALPGMQEGRWPDLRLRGSVLGSEQLVDVVAGRLVLGDRSGALAATLDEERRLCYVAATRARRRLIATAVAAEDGEELPSRFLTELAGAEPELATPIDQPQALTLPALVARLRTVVADPAAGQARRRAAARQLARLAAAGVPGAHPDQWWGLRSLSDDGPVAEPDETVTVSPSMVEQAQRCGLRWLLERHGGAAPPGPERAVGNLVHAAAERADGLTQAELLQFLDEHWGVIEVSARWEEGRKREQATQMIERLVRWLATNPRELVGTEQSFRVRLPGTNVEIAGTVDRLERDADGRLVVIDFKTGKTIPTADDVARHPQLGVYQLAVALGGFERFGPAESGGAALVQLGRDRRGGPEQRQEPLKTDVDPEWAERTVRDAATTMSGAAFTARVNQHCATCAVRICCPLSPHGRQVVAPDDPPQTRRESDSAGRATRDGA